MKNILFFIIFTVSLFTSCAVIKQESMMGKYIGETPAMNSFVPASEVDLSLNSDGTFNLYWSRADYTGKWSFLDKKNILLELDIKTEPGFYLRSGALSVEEIKIKIINSSKLKFCGINFRPILIRVN